MAEIKTINGINILLDNNRAFLPSKNINIFPCSRRGQYEMEPSVKHYDPEARLNTERTNRLHTAINGFTDSFIINNNFEIGDNLAFTLYGYRVEVKDFSPADIATALNISIDGSTDSIIYAHLSLHDGISLSTEDYYTEILYRQSTMMTDINYLDVTYTANRKTEDFFVGVSFVSDQNISDGLPSKKLPLFSNVMGSWGLIQTSLLPKIEHGTTEDSIKVSGDFTADGTTWLKGAAQIDGETTIYNELLIKSGNTTRAEIDSSKVSFNLPVTVNDTLQVKRTTGTGPAAVVEGSLEVHDDISTETLNTNTIQSVETIKTDNVKGLVVTSTAVSPERTLKVEGKTDVSGDAGIEGRLTVSSNIDTNTLKAVTDIVTPVLKTNTITSNNTEIVIDKVLKVDTIDSDATNGLIVKQATKLEKTLVVEGTTTVNDTITAEKLIIPSTIDENGEEKGEVVTPILRVNRLTTNSGDITVDDKNLIVTKNLEVLAAKAMDEEDRGTAATATIDKAVIGQLEVKVDNTKLTGSTGKIAAKEIAAEKITQNGNQVPVLAIEQVSDKGVTPEIWQLQITNVIKKPKN